METVEVWTPDRRRAAMACAREWAGTPWGNRRSERGRAVDCIHFVVRVLEAAEIFPPIQLPYYSPSLGIRATTNVMSRLFEEVAHVETCDVRPPPFGAILIWRVGQTSNHVGIMLEEPWHVMRRSFVKWSTWNAVSPAIETVQTFTATGLRCPPASLEIR